MLGRGQAWLENAAGRCAITRTDSKSSGYGGEKEEEEGREGRRRGELGEPRRER